MSYYILTSDSNLGNILSTESISPASLYSRRSHGFRWIDAVWDGLNVDFIHLRGKFPDAPTPSDDYGAMVLELDEGQVNNVQSDNFGGMWTSDTIRITPTKCRFVFYSQDNLDAAFNGVKRSLEAKYVSQYRAKAIVKAADTERAQESFDNLDMATPPTESMPSESVAQFETIDRFKGAIFGYCLGDDLSLAKDIRTDFVDFMATANEMINAVTQAPIDSLEGSRRVLESILYKLALRSELKDMQPEDRPTFDLDKRLNTIRKSSSVELPLGMRNDSFTLNMYRSELEERIRKAVGRRPKSLGRPTILSDGEAPRLCLPNKDGSLAESMINSLIENDILNLTCRDLGYPFALQCGKIAREHLGECWESSGERSYINKLLPHLNVGDEFDPNDDYGIEDEKAHTALIILTRLCEQSDNKELDSFYRYLLIKCRVTDFSLAFALWGAAFGFSEMPKTLCDAMSPSAEAAARKLFGELLSVLNCKNGIAS